MTRLPDVQSCRFGRALGVYQGLEPNASAADERRLGQPRHDVPVFMERQGKEPRDGEEHQEAREEDQEAREEDQEAREEDQEAREEDQKAREEHRKTREEHRKTREEHQKTERRGGTNGGRSIRTAE